MRPLLVFLFLAATASQALNLNRLQTQAAQLQAVNKQRQTAPAQDQPKLEAQRQQLVTEIRGAAEAEPKEYVAQYAVARGLFAAGEEGHATVYADRATEVAQQAGDKKKEAAALTLAALAYQRAGDMDAANDRAKKALWIDPKNSTALTVLMTTKDRLSKGQGKAGEGMAAPPAGKDAPLPPVTAATSGSGRSGYGPQAAPTPHIQFIGGDTQKAAKLMGEAQRTWKLDRKAALKLFDEAVAADAKSAAVRAARARARLETKDYKGALEDADASLVGGPSGEAHFVRAVALKALGGKAEDIKAAYDAAAAADSRYAADYQSYIAALGRDEAPQGGSAPSQAPAMAPERGDGRDYLVVGAVAAMVLTLFAGAILLRRRNDTEG